jgi:hypothetical protein
MSSENVQYADMILAQHIDKMNFTLRVLRNRLKANDKTAGADEVSYALTSLLNTYGELSKVHTAMLVEELTENVVQQNV